MIDYEISNHGVTVYLCLYEFWLSLKLKWRADHSTLEFLYHIAGNFKSSYIDPNPNLQITCFPFRSQNRYSPWNRSNNWLHRHRLFAGKRSTALSFFISCIYVANMPNHNCCSCSISHITWICISEASIFRSPCLHFLCWCFCSVLIQFVSQSS